MVDPTPNDNDVARAAERPPAPDAHSQAAVLLVESLIHGLIARSVISVSDAVEIVEVAIDVNEEFVSEPDGSPATMRTSLTILDAIRNSLEIDLSDKEIRPWPPLA